MVKFFFDRFSRLDTIPACDIQTDRQTSFDSKDRAYACRRAGKKRLREYVKDGGRHLKHLLNFKKVLFALVLNAISVRQFFITLKRQVVKQRSFVKAVDGGTELSRFVTN